MTERKIVTVLEPEDEYTHTPDEASNYNESMYLNAFDLKQEIGGWFRLGNRVNEGFAEMTVCIYLPGGRVGFVYARPEISSNDEMRAGGLHIDVVEPFKHLKVTYSGKVCVLDEPGQMADPRVAFKNNPWVECEVNLDYRGVSPMFGGKPQWDDGTELEIEAEKSFSKAHYEQHCSVTGTIRVGEETIEMDGLGLRDKSWGPRYWQAIEWYRWLPFIFSDKFAMMVSNVGGRAGGMVLDGDEYKLITNCTIDSDWDENHYQTKMRMHVETQDKSYDVTGEVISLIPLRNRRPDPEGNMLTTRITEAMTRFECNGQVGMGMSEYLDQIVDGVPVGPDVEV
jgi:hypothetical protein